MSGGANGGFGGFPQGFTGTPSMSQGQPSSAQSSPNPRSAAPAQNPNTGWAPAAQTNIATPQYPQLQGGYWNRQSQMMAGPSYQSTQQNPVAANQSLGAYLQGLMGGTIPVGGALTGYYAPSPSVQAGSPSQSQIQPIAPQSRTQ